VRAKRSTTLRADVVFKARGEQTDGTLTAFENLVAAGDGPPLHTHANEDESLCVLDGEVRFKLGDETQAAPAGSFVFILRGAPHAWSASSTVSQRSRPGPAAFETVGPELGIDVVGPPLAQSDPA
jgi:quercetin dioxygenase-like cupin family protein